MPNHPFDSQLCPTRWLAPLGALLFSLFVAGTNAQPYTQISAGENHTCALLDSGGVHCWGDNFRGQLGNTTALVGDESGRAIRVLNISTAAQIAAGREHNCAALKNGTVRCWGYNFRGQLGDGSTAANAVPVQVVGISNAVAVAAGGDHSCALIAGGTIKCWGYNADGELGAGSTAFSSLSALDVVGITNAIAISAGMLHTCALLANNRVRCWGYNNFGALGDGTFVNRNAPVEISSFVATAIDAGWHHTCATYSGSVYCWGSNTNGLLGDTTTSARNLPVQSQGINAASQVAGGEIHTCARLTLGPGELRCWGNGGDGRLGNGETLNSLSPVRVLGYDNFIAVTAGRQHTCALIDGGSAKCWGRNTFGQLGNGEWGPTSAERAPLYTAPKCELDIDGDGAINAATDGVIATRVLAGLTGTNVTAGALGVDATRTTWAQIRLFLERACGVVGLKP